MNRRTITELIDTNEPGWSHVSSWINEATNKVEVLPVDNTAREKALLSTQVTTRSILGAVIYETGGLLIDNGWLRIYGSGNSRLSRTLPEWNSMAGIDIVEGNIPFLLVADDAVGGFYAIDGGVWGTRGHVHYHSPEKLAWEDLGSTYGDFVLWCLTADLNWVYESVRWHNWIAETRDLPADQGIFVYPPLSAKGPVVANRKRSNVPMLELYKLYVEELPKQIL